MHTKICLSKGEIEMRKCIRCGAEMMEDFTYTGPGGNILRRKGLGAKAVYPQAAVCPECGEVSIYVEADKLERN